MNQEECLGIGIEINPSNINICALDTKGEFLEAIQLMAPKPFMPGATIIQICEFIGSNQDFRSLKYIGLCFPGIVDKDCRFIKRSRSYKEWDGVPLAEWLEARLKTKVYIQDTNDCEISMTEHGSSVQIYSAALAVGYRARKKLLSTMITL
tara:strand:+ start:19548 stop:20000 length:453 start_codon:yes stop_codon:yes gene_type:complete